jgi:hypothetical protein
VAGKGGGSKAHGPYSRFQPGMLLPREQVLRPSRSRINSSPDLSETPRHRAAQCGSCKCPSLVDSRELNSPALGSTLMCLESFHKSFHKLLEASFNNMKIKHKIETVARI